MYLIWWIVRCFLWRNCFNVFLLICVLFFFVLVFCFDWVLFRRVIFNDVLYFCLFDNKGIIWILFFDSEFFFKIINYFFIDLKIICFYMIRCLYLEIYFVGMGIFLESLKNNMIVNVNSLIYYYINNNYFYKFNVLVVIVCFVYIIELYYLK